MKVAVSIPDHVFAESEELAARLKTSRSQLYRRALIEFIARHQPNQVTEQMNRVVDEISSGTSDGFARTAARHVLGRVQW